MELLLCLLVIVRGNCQKGLGLFKKEEVGPWGPMHEDGIFEGPHCDPLFVGTLI